MLKKVKGFGFGESKGLERRERAKPRSRMAEGY